MSENQDQAFEGDLFAANRVKELNNEDFALGTTDGITLYSKGCSIVLFYDKTSASLDFRDIWDQLANEFGGVSFGSVNFNNRTDIMKRFNQIAGSPNHWANQYAKVKPPYILVFREDEPGIAYPQAVYSGEKTYDALYDWILNLACEPGYNEFPEDEPQSSTSKAPRSQIQMNADEDQNEMLDEEEDNDRLEISSLPSAPLRSGRSQAGVGYLTF